MDALSQNNVLEFSAALAADLAAEIYNQETIFNNHGLSIEAGEQLLALPWFRNMVEQAKRDWGALDNVKDRIRVKAQITLEESLPTIYSLITDKQNPAAARVAAFKEIKEVAGLAAKESESPPSFIPVHIFLGDGKPPLTIAPGPGGYTRAPEELEDEVDEESPTPYQPPQPIQSTKPRADGLEPSTSLGMLDEDHF